MQDLLAPCPAWPRAFPRDLKPRASLSGLRPLNAVQRIDQYAEYQARRLRDREDAIRNGGLTQTYGELFFTNFSDFSAVASTSSEASLLAGSNQQPVIPALTLNTRSKAISFIARGVFSTTSTPTLIFQWRLGATAGSTFLSGTSVGISSAITTASGVSNKFWESRLDLVVYTPGIGTGNASLSGAGYVMSMSGFGTPFFYPLEPTTPDTATWTSTVDAAVTQYVNLSVTWSASSASNTITCKQLQAFCWN